MTNWLITPLVLVASTLVPCLYPLVFIALFFARDINFFYNTGGGVSPKGRNRFQLFHIILISWLVD